MTATQEIDPLGFARAQYAAYKHVGRPTPPPPGPGKIRMEPSRPTSRPVKKAAARSGEPWTDEERMVLVRRYLKNELPEVIATDLGRTFGSVKTQLQQIGFDVEGL